MLEELLKILLTLPEFALTILTVFPFEISSTRELLGNWENNNMALLSLSTAKVGDVFPPTSYMIHPENVKRYAEVNEVSLPASASFPCVPPGMLAHDLVWIASRYFDITGVLLTGLELKFEKPVADSGMITVRDARIQDIFFQDGDQYIVASFNVVNDRDDVLCRSKITCVSKAAKGQAD